MSMHAIALSELEEEGLRAHGLDIGTPSQLSDAFRHGVKWALEQSAPERVSVPTDAELVEIASKLGALPELCFTEDHPEVRWRIRPEVRALTRALLNGGGV